MPTPKDLPKELRGIWDVQYEKREKKLLQVISPKARPLYRKKPYWKKMELIDDAVSGGLI